MKHLNLLLKGHLADNLTDTLLILHQRIIILLNIT